MLDDLYKTVVVLITEHYVKDQTMRYPAASASKALFAEMKKKGWHEVRLLGLTDKLFNPENKPSDAFEQAAAKSCLQGRRAMKRSSRKVESATCASQPGYLSSWSNVVMCHPTWKGNKGNIGSLSYTVPVVE